MGKAARPPSTSDSRGKAGTQSVPSVRVFACLGGDDLAEELRAAHIPEALSTAQGQLHTTVKLRVPVPCVEFIAHVVASFPGVGVYTRAGGDGEALFFLVGPLHAIEECARALCPADEPVSSLAHEILRELPLLYPRRYGRLEGRNISLDFSVKTGIMGILNVTPDSFYDGGRYAERQAALERAQQMVEEGADIIDIGGQSSRPGSDPVSEVEEGRRVLPVVEAVAQAVGAIVSVDTYRAPIARAALDAGAHLINDISALRFDPRLLEVVAERQVPLILMHMQGQPRDMHLNPMYKAVVDEVFAFFQERIAVAHKGGIAVERLLIDPGIGFGKNAVHNLELLRKLHHFQALGRPLVIGTSRKAFIGRILGTGVEERLEGTAATVAAAIAQGVSVVRVHDVRQMARVARMMDAIIRPHAGLHEAGQGSPSTLRASSDPHPGSEDRC